jgi:hypothetical protein
MIGKLLNKEEVNAALAIVLSGAVMVLVAKGSGPLSPGRIVSGVLSNPIPGGAAGPRGVSVLDLDEPIAA